MSIDPDDVTDGIRQGVSQLLSRGAADDARADRRVAAAVSQLAQPAELRLDDRTRAMIGANVSSLIAAVESELRAYASQTLGSRGAADLASFIVDDPPTVEPMLIDAGLFAQADLVAELVARATQDLIGDALPLNAPARHDEPSLVARLAEISDSHVSSAAVALLSADARRRESFDDGDAARTDLPAELHHRIVWLVAAAIGRQVARHMGAANPAVDRVLTEAALRSLAAHDEGARMEAAAVQLAAAVNANADELPDLLVEAIADRQLALFIALIAHAMTIGYDLARDIVLDPVADRLWLVLRSIELNRAAIARIGLALSEADPRRDVEAFADKLDIIAAVESDAARAAIAPMLRHPDYRAAAISLARGIAA